MKKCKECGDEFNHRRKGSVYCSEKCRCVYKSKKARGVNGDRINMLRRRNKRIKKNDVYVYQLPCGYVGVSNDLLNRMSVHRHVGRITEGYIVLAQCPTRDEALDLEALYQTITNQKVDNAGRLRHIL